MYRAAEVTLPVSRDTILEKTRFSTFSLVPPSGVKVRMVGGESASALTSASRLPHLQTLILKTGGVTRVGGMDVDMLTDNCDDSLLNSSTRDRG
jgi:hypothetical protein